MTTTEKQFDSIILKCIEVFSAKMKDYGSAWRILRLPSLTDQIYIKAQRIRSLQTKKTSKINEGQVSEFCLLYTSPSPRDVEESRMPSSA